MFLVLQNIDKITATLHSGLNANYKYYVFIPLCHFSYHMLQSRFEDYVRSILYMILSIKWKSYVEFQGMIMETF